MIIAASKEIKAPMYIDLQTVRGADGLSRFQAIAMSSSISSFSSSKVASISLALTLLDLMKSKIVASLLLYSS